MPPNVQFSRWTRGLCFPYRLALLGLPWLYNTTYKPYCKQIHICLNFKLNHYILWYGGTLNHNILCFCGITYRVIVLRTDLKNGIYQTLLIHHKMHIFLITTLNIQPHHTNIKMIYYKTYLDTLCIHIHQIPSTHKTNHFTHKCKQISQKQQQHICKITKNQTFYCAKFTLDIPTPQCYNTTVKFT